MYLKKIVKEGVGWINLAQNRDEKRAAVTTVPLALQEIICSIWCRSCLIIYDNILSYV
jgi:hypothetical protein